MKASLARRIRNAQAVLISALDRRSQRLASTRSEMRMRSSFATAARRGRGCLSLAVAGGTLQP